jgi:AraC-like DNA-binding protein
MLSSLRLRSALDEAALEAPSGAQHERFTTLLARLTPALGRNDTPLPALRCYRSPRPTAPGAVVYEPSLCIVGQGEKEARLGQRVFRYGPLHYLVSGAALPVHARILEASAQTPFLSMVLDIGTAEVRELLAEIETDADPMPVRWEGAPPLRVSPLDARLLDAVIRLLESVADPVDARVLAPAAFREIVYLALRREQGDLLRLAVRRDRRSPGIARALHFIHRHLDERVDVATLARTAGMSASALHQRFKSATTLTPIQYLKRMRLDRARQLMLEEGCQAAEAALRVGYESPSQFSREFKRLFGMPPRRYLERASPGAA